MKNKISTGINERLVKGNRWRQMRSMLFHWEFFFSFESWPVRPFKGRILTDLRYCSRNVPDGLGTIRWCRKTGVGPNPEEREEVLFGLCEKGGPEEWRERESLKEGGLQTHWVRVWKNPEEGLIIETTGFIIETTGFINHWFNNWNNYSSVPLE